MIAQCWLHIGIEKTGSTSIQNFLARNRTDLRTRGWLYPESAGAKTHYALAAFSLDDERRDRTRRMFDIGDRTSLDEFRHRLVNSLTGEIARSGTANLVLSNELLSTRLRRADEVTRLKVLCDQLAAHTKIVVYIRNQADFLVSRYTNVIWEGGTAEFTFRARTAIADYTLLLDRWSQAFGKENIVVRRFEPSEFPGGDVVCDFARVIGLDIGGLHRPARSNPSLDAESLVFLRDLNRRMPQVLQLRFEAFRGAIVRILQRRRRGSKFVIPHVLAQRIEDAYAESNARVSADYFGSRFEPLFSPPALVSDTVSQTRISSFTAARIALFLVSKLLQETFIRAVKHRNLDERSVR